MLEIMKYLRLPLDENIEKAKLCGDFERALTMIAQRLADEKVPDAMKQRLRIEQEVLRRLPYEYPAGTVVEIFGPHLSIDTMAAELQTIPHEIMTLLSDRVTRTYRENGQFVLEGNTRIDASMKKK